MHGLPHVQLDEVLRFAGGHLGYAFNLDPDQVGCVLLDSSDRITAGSRVERMHTVLDTPVGDQLLGRVVDPVGRPLDGGRSLDDLPREPCERDAPPIMQRAPVTVPLQSDNHRCCMRAANQQSKRLDRKRSRSTQYTWSRPRHQIFLPRWRRNSGGIRSFDQRLPMPFPLMRLSFPGRGRFAGTARVLFRDRV